MGSIAVRSAAVASAVWALGCGEPPQRPGPPAAPHGSVILEPSTLHVGALVTIEIALVTPPDHRVPPIELSEPIAPLWLLDAERLPVRRQGERWVHTTRLRARVREAPGEYEWPAQTVAVETPEGEEVAVTLEARPFVVSASAEAAEGRLEPFGLRTPEAQPEGGTGGAWAGAAAGSLFTLLALAGVRRWRARRAAQRVSPEPEDTTPPWQVAERELGVALEHVASDPRAAADHAAQVLRRYVTRRSGRNVDSLTTEEIAAQRPPGRLRSRWPELVDLLRRLDAQRFPGKLDDAEEHEALRAWLEEARGFVERSVPPRELR